MTSVSDGRTHTITAAEFEQGLMQGSGRYRAACGADVLVTSMTTDPGPRCARCGEARRERERTTAPRGLLVHLARRARGSRPSKYS